MLGINNAQYRQQGFSTFLKERLDHLWGGHLKNFFHVYISCHNILGRINELNYKHKCCRVCL